MGTLAQLRDYATNDGEEYWNVGVAHAVEALHGELQSWPTARFLNPSNGEIKVAPLGYLIDSIAEAIDRGETIRLEPSG